MPFITSSINATVSRQTSRRADQQCAAYAALMELPKDALARIMQRFDGYDEADGAIA